MIDNNRFEEIRNRIINGNHMKMGIGTLKEKTVHMVLKEYYEPNIDYHEVVIDKYVADICRGNYVTEIQTGNFNKMREKLEYLLKEHDVTIVYPIPHIKWLNWIDEESHEVKSRRKSPKCGVEYSVFYELYKIKQYLDNSRLHLKIVMIDVDEFRLLNGWSEDKKKGSVRYDRIPIRIVKEIDIEEVRDYMQLIPYDLKSEFTTKDYSKASKLTMKKAWYAINILNHLNIIERIDKKGKAYIYKCMY